MPKTKEQKLTKEVLQKAGIVRVLKTDYVAHGVGWDVWGLENQRLTSAELGTVANALGYENGKLLLYAIEKLRPKDLFSCVSGDAF